MDQVQDFCRDPSVRSSEQGARVGQMLAWTERCQVVVLVKIESGQDKRSAACKLYSRIQL